MKINLLSNRHFALNIVLPWSGQTDFRYVEMALKSSFAISGVGLPSRR